MGEVRSGYKFWIGTSQEAISIGRPKCSWKYFKIDLKGEGGRIWTGFIWLRICTCGGQALPNPVMNLGAL
jgi:hypothetical protein